VGDDDDDDDLVEIEDLEADEFNWEEDSELISLDELPQISSPWGEMRGLDEEDSEASPETPLQNFYRELAREASPDEALASAEGDEPFWEASDEAHDDEEAAHVREHARFAELPPIVEEEIASVNWDELTFRLNHWDSD